jgi:hypothetical protein
MKGKIACSFSIPSPKSAFKFIQVRFWLNLKGEYDKSNIKLLLDFSEMALIPKIIFNFGIR